MWTNIARMRAVAATMIVLLMLATGTARADDILFDIKDVAEIDTERPVPKFTIERVADHRNDGQKYRNKGQEDYLIQWKLTDGRAVTVGRFIRWPADNVQLGWASDGIDQRTVVAGWLKGAKDLLVIAAASETVPGGSGHYVDRRYLIVRLADKEEPAVLLRREVCVEGRTIHVRDSGLDGAFYQFDSATNTMRETLSRSAWPLSMTRQPLYHLTKQTDDEGIDEAWGADIHERVVHEMDYRDGKLTFRSVALYYATQKLDTFEDIAAYYLGRYAPASAIIRANPQLKPDEQGVIRVPPAGEQLRIPVSQAWLRQNFLRDVPADDSPNS